MDEITANRRTAYRILLIEAVTIFLFSLFFYALFSLEYAYSVVLGGLAFILPNSLFIMFSLGRSAASSRSALTWFYVGELIKIVTTILIFTISIVLVAPLNIGLMFVAYGVMVLINLTGLAISMNK